MSLHTLSLPEHRRPRLAAALREQRLLRAIECHNPLVGDDRGFCRLLGRASAARVRCALGQRVCARNRYGLAGRRALICSSDASTP